MLNYQRVATRFRGFIHDRIGDKMFVGPLSGWKRGKVGKCLNGKKPREGRWLLFLPIKCQLVLCFSAQLLCWSKSRNVNLDHSRSVMDMTSGFRSTIADGFIWQSLPSGPPVSIELDSSHISTCYWWNYSIFNGTTPIKFQGNPTWDEVIPIGDLWWRSSRAAALDALRGPRLGPEMDRQFWLWVALQWTNIAIGKPPFVDDVPVLKPAFTDHFIDFLLPCLITRGWVFGIPCFGLPKLDPHPYSTVTYLILRIVVSVICWHTHPLG